MKNKFREWMSRMESAHGVKWIFSAWRMLSHNFGLKVLSLLIAILMWNFVVTSNSSITRTKPITGLTCYINNQSALNTYGLALLDNLNEELSGINAIVEVSQADYAYVSEDNVQVTLDLSGIRTAGTREVQFKASSTYGRVVRVVPSSITLTVESLDSRQIPINVQITGDKKNDLWYSLNRSNPSSVTISGAASLVQSIAKAYVYVDVTDADHSFESPERYVLLDREGNEIPQTMLNRSSTSVSASVDIYPTKELPISSQVEEVISGQPADGYVVENVTIQPESVVVAAEEELLDSLSELHISPITVQGQSQSFTVRSAINTLSSFKSISATDVYVNVTIAEETIGAWVENVDVSYANKGENLSLTDRQEKIRVYITGPRSAIEALQEAGFAATADLTALGTGTHEIPLTFPVETYPNVTFTPENNEVNVTLEDAVQETDAD